MIEAIDSAILEMLKDPAQKDKGFVKLMDLYKEPMYWHIRRLVVSHDDAEDILQETFINVYRYADSFRGDSKIATWLYRIATNECSRHFLKNKGRIKTYRSLETSTSGDQSGNDLEDSSVILQKFQQAILQLPKKQKVVFNLRYYDELSYEEISKILRSSVSSLKTNFHLASEKIKQYLINHA